MAHSSSASSIPRHKYDVFCASEVIITSHLYAALRQKQIKAFIDNELDRGEEISPALLEVIKESMISVIIFSENFGSSPRCLEELVKIPACKKIARHMVVPVFYQVDPLDVAEQTGNFGNEFVSYMDSLDTVRRWRAALTEAANLSGWNSLVTGPGSNLVEEIVKDVLKKLNHMWLCESKGLVGINTRLEKIESLLCIRLSAVCFLGLWGMGGIGKTAIVAALYDRIPTQFDGSCFLANFREQSEKYGIFHL